MDTPLHWRAYQDSSSNMWHVPTLSELVGFPSSLSDKERGACMMVANLFGVEAAQDEAKKIIAKRETKEIRLSKDNKKENVR